mmetsp:Transcript_7966/g.19881  ORF Transcript_7966/g.19881 Transcript_7966/m.19881 type:complete len:235 (+) Transcript_7966:296-1000(+)
MRAGRRVAELPPQDVQKRQVHCHLRGHADKNRPSERCLQPRLPQGVFAGGRFLAEVFEAGQTTRQKSGASQGKLPVFQGEFRQFCERSRREGLEHKLRAAATGRPPRRLGGRPASRTLKPRARARAAGWGIKIWRSRLGFLFFFNYSQTATQKSSPPQNPTRPTIALAAASPQPLGVPGYESPRSEYDFKISTAIFLSRSGSAPYTSHGDGITLPSASLPVPSGVRTPCSVHPM